MKTVNNLLITIFLLFFLNSYSFPQSIKITKSDNDSLWHDFKYMFSDIKRDGYWITVRNNKIIFYDEFACDMSDVDPKTLEKIYIRINKNK